MISSRRRDWGGANGTFNVDGGGGNGFGFCDWGTTPPPSSPSMSSSNSELNLNMNFNNHFAKRTDSERHLMERVSLVAPKDWWIDPISWGGFIVIELIILGVYLSRDEISKMVVSSKMWEVDWSLLDLHEEIYGSGWWWRCCRWSPNATCNIPDFDICGNLEYSYNGSLIRIDRCQTANLRLHLCMIGSYQIREADPMYTSLGSPIVHIREDLIKNRRQIGSSLSNQLCVGGKDPIPIIESLD